MQVELITPESSLFSGEAKQVTLPGVAGEFGVLDGHEPLVSLLKSGVIVVENASNALRFAVHGGVAEVRGDALNIMAEHAVSLAGLSIEAARAAADATRAKLVASVVKDEQAELQAKLAFEMVIVEALAA